ncbi:MULTISPECIES: hypothetical protein [unclassified Synechococcus]|nr:MULTISPECIES: hypothetical protein [unclassified Synechococcus]
MVGGKGRGLEVKIQLTGGMILLASINLSSWGMVNRFMVDLA